MEIRNLPSVHVQWAYTSLCTHFQGTNFFLLVLLVPNVSTF